MPGRYGNIHTPRAILARMIRSLFSVFLFLSLAVPTHASVADGWKAYESGDYQRARQLFLKDDSAEGFAAACRAELVIGGYFSPPVDSARTLHDALDHCDEAIRRDPAHADAGISYAVALGFEAKRAKKPGYAKAGRQRLEALLLDYDNYGILHAALGGWHAAVSNAGFMARMYLGASRKKANSHFERAVELMPGDIGVRFEFIKFLAQGKKRDKAQALEEIAILVSLTPYDAFDRFLQARAQAVADAIKAADKQALKQALAAATAFDKTASAKDVAPYAYGDDS